MEGLQISDKNPRIDINNVKKTNNELKELTNHRNSRYSDTYQIRIFSCVLTKTY